VRPGEDSPAGSGPGPQQQLQRRPCRYRARAWWGDLLVADSVNSVRVEEPGQEPELYFPLADVHLAHLRDEGRERARSPKGTARLWSIDAPGGAPFDPTPRDWSRPPTRVDGRDCMWTFDQPASGLEWLKGRAAFDPDRIRVELEDTRPGDEARDVTFKRFPTWGEASDLIEILDVRREGDGRFVSVARSDPRRPVVEGSQILGQAVVAAGRQARGRRVVSGHMVFLRAADARLPLQFQLDKWSDGRTFSCFGVRVDQGERLCASGNLLLDVTATDVIRHAVPAPEVAGPYQSEPYDMSVTGRDVRVVDGAYSNDPEAPAGPPVLDAWVRFRDVPDDPDLNAGLLAQFTGHMSIAAGLRPHEGIGQIQSHRSLSTAINAIAISFHRAIRADGWMLYHHESTFAGDGMTHSTCRVHDGEGRLLASFSVDAMVRRFEAGAGAADDRTSL
jgi:acyl-CoA thioesterase II